MRKTAFLFTGAGLLFLVVKALTPVPIVTEEESLVTVGVVRTVQEGGVKDVVLQFQGDDRHFYINRGLERGLLLDELRSRLVGNEVVVKYPDYWTPLDPNRSTIHISYIGLGDEVLFNEFKAG